MNPSNGISETSSGASFEFTWTNFANDDRPMVPSPSFAVLSARSNSLMNINHTVTQYNLRELQWERTRDAFVVRSFVVRFP